MPAIAATLGTAPEITDMTRREYEKRLRVSQAGDPDDDSVDIDDDAAERLREFDSQYRELRLALLGNKRATVLRLRNEHRIDDAVLRQIQARLDCRGGAAVADAAGPMTPPDPPCAALLQLQPRMPSRRHRPTRPAR